jgi:hypothetical protein
MAADVMPTKLSQQPASLMTPLPRHERKALSIRLEILTCFPAGVMVF